MLRSQNPRGSSAALSVTLVMLMSIACLALVRDATANSTVALAACGLWFVSITLSLTALRLDALSPAMIYLYLLGLFHLGMVVPWALGIEATELPLWLVTNDLNPALALVMVALASYHAGAAMAVWLWPAPPAAAPRSQRSYNSVLGHLGLAIVAIGVGAFWAGVSSLGLERLLRSDYGETYVLASQHDPRLFATSMTLVPLGLYLAAAAVRRRFLVGVISLGVVWGGCILYLGFRGYAFVPAVTILAVLQKRGLRLPRHAYAAAAVTLLLLIPFVRAARSQRLAERSASAVVSLRAPLEAVEEMGGTLRAVVDTVRFLKNEPFRWGLTYWQALRSAVPNTAFDWQGGEYLPFEQLPPSHWLTLQAAPETYRVNGGLGFSAIAEPYMNFGVPGVAIYFFLLALVLVAIYRFDVTRPTRLALWAVILGPLLWTVRNDFHGFFRPVIIGCMAVALARLLGNARPVEPRPRGAPVKASLPKREAGYARAIRKPLGESAGT